MFLFVVKMIIFTIRLELKTKIMWTSLKQNSEYSAQITPYNGKVHAEIIRRDKDKGFHEHKLNLWLTVSHKSFGSIWRNAPTEKDWKSANKWMNEQLELIEKYGTVMVTKPKHIIELNAQQTQHNDNQNRDIAVINGVSTITEE